MNVRSPRSTTTTGALATAASNASVNSSRTARSASPDRDTTTGPESVDVFIWNCATGAAPFTSATACWYHIMPSQPEPGAGARSRRSGNRRRRAPHDQLGGQLDMVGVQLFAGGQPDRGTQGDPADLAQRLAHRGQRRRRQPGHLRVVEA